MNTLGKHGEDVAMEYLESLSYIILHRNWAVRGKELDLVALKDDCLHFVEVKSRTEPVFLAPELSIDFAKRKALLTAARAYIKRYNLSYEAQFDLITVVFGPEGHRVRFYERAFYPQNRNK